eukprot:44877_1
MMLNEEHHYVTPVEQQEGVIDTSIEPEEIDDPLYQFLISNKHLLKADRNTVINEFYNKLNINKFDMDELMMSSETNLTEVLKEYKLKASNINRLIILMKKTKHSAIYKEYNKSNVLIVSLSTKEQEARKNINNIQQKVLGILSNIDIDLKQLNINNQNTKNIVNDKFDEIIKQTNTKR